MQLSNCLIFTLDWADLTEEQKNAAILLGYTQALWDGNGSSPKEGTKWSDLTPEEQAAATTLGYDDDDWDDDEGKRYICSVGLSIDL